jgi:pSer/pThr/pTyr-binding forkhead associated (FHA) protein
MSQPNSESAQGSGVPASPGFSQRTAMELAEVLQTSCPGRHSGQITFRSGASYGYVFLQHGQVLHAMCGTVEGEEAVYLMLSWPAGSYTLDEDILPHKRTINMTWEQLLFEGARRADVGNIAPNPTTPVTTANPLTSTRMKDNQPKLIIAAEGHAPVTFELEHEYTRVGRAEDNELMLPDGSVSSRHCIFVLSGADVVLRDLNSSNGTYVNGEQISETVLRPGDNIQVGVIDIKFVPGVRRPKLTKSTVATSPAKARKDVLPANPNLGNTTIKLPNRAPRTDPAPRMLDNEAFVKGTSAISYDQLAPPEESKKAPPWALIIGGTVVLLLVLAGAVWFFVLKP